MQIMRAHLKQTNSCEHRPMMSNNNLSGTISSCNQWTVLARVMDDDWTTDSLPCTSVMKRHPPPSSLNLTGSSVAAIQNVTLSDFFFKLTSPLPIKIKQTNKQKFGRVSYIIADIGHLLNLMGSRCMSTVNSDQKT